MEVGDMVKIKDDFRYNDHSLHLHNHLGPWHIPRLRGKTGILIRYAPNTCHVFVVLWSGDEMSLIQCDIEALEVISESR